MGEDRERARAGRDVAGVGPDPREVRHLMPLGELRNVRVSSGEPDIRGWHVYSSAGRDLGKVDDLLIDTTRGEVAMLDIGLAESDRHTLAPIRAAWVDREHKRVILDGAQFDAGEEIPSLSRGRVSDEEAQRFGERYDRAYGERGIEADRPTRVRQGSGEIRIEQARERSADSNAARLSNWRVVDHEPGESTPQPATSEETGERASAAAGEPREVRYPTREENTPRIVEEVVVRRRIVDEGDAQREPPPAS